MLNTLFALCSSTLALPSPHAKASATAASQLTWTDCSATYGSGFTCTNLTVPVDWCDPDGGKSTLGMSRYQSNFTSGHAKRNLFINYGGPGGITTQTLPKTLTAFSDEVLAEFDISTFLRGACPAEKRWRELTGDLCSRRRSSRYRDFYSSPMRRRLV